MAWELQNEQDRSPVVCWQNPFFGLFTESFRTLIRFGHDHACEFTAWISMQLKRGKECSNATS